VCWSQTETAASSEATKADHNTPCCGLPNPVRARGLASFHGWRVALATIAVLALGASPASGAVTIGSPLSFDPNDSGGGEQTYVQIGLPGSAIATSPINGVITRWRARGFTQGADPAEIRLRVMRSAGIDTFTAVSSSSALLPTSLAFTSSPPGSRSRRATTSA
jgi:hypothetical protein